jgi:hypothetical protein
MYNRLSEGGTGLVAQRLEQRTHNPLVPGSNPGGPTIYFQSVRSFVLVVAVLAMVPIFAPCRVHFSRVLFLCLQNQVTQNLAYLLAYMNAVGQHEPTQPLDF